MMEAMASAGVAGAMLCGCPLKKHWSEYERCCDGCSIVVKGATSYVARHH